MSGTAELPFERNWWIDAGRVIGGRYPGTADVAESVGMLGRLLDVGVSVIVNLQEPAEVGGGGKPFRDYGPDWLRLAAGRGVDGRVLRFPVRDWGTPTDGQMSTILSAIAAAVADGRRAYVHCWGGHGRTGTVAGCWLVQNGQTPTAALDAIRRARRHDAHLAGFDSPQSAEQVAMVRRWLDVVRAGRA